MPVNILNLPGYRVADVRESEREYHVKAETIAPVGACPACHGSATVGHGRVEILVHDLPVHGKQVGVYVDARRLRCQGCGKTFMETLPGVNDARRMTQRLVKWISERSLRHTFTSIAEEIGVAEGTIRNVFADHVAELERTVKFQTPHWMGIDEIHIIRRPRAVISNLKNNTAVNMLPDRDKKTVARYLAGLPGREGVRYVAIDMWVPYREAVREVLPDAIVVVDKFHVQRLGNMALDEFRRSLAWKFHEEVGRPLDPVVRFRGSETRNVTNKGGSGRCQSVRRAWWILGASDVAWCRARSTVATSSVTAG